MCGIAGWVHWEKDLRTAKSEVQGMADPMACRGPDAEGVWTSVHAAFSHRRLIVIDPEGGSQPMVREVAGRRYVLVYNGELYNTEDLRQQLQAQGYQFIGHSDTEVVLVAYIAWGPSAVERFNGIFAIGLFDEAIRRLWLVRDRLGVKPLFWALRNNGLIFASDMRAMLAHPEIQAEIGPDGMAEIFGLGPARTPGHGIFRNVHELKPGHCLEFTPRGVVDRTYWKLESHPHGEDVSTTAGHLRDLLEDTVSRQLVADVPVVTLLSGGLDSSIVTALAARSVAAQHRGPLHTYSIDFVDMERYFENNGFQTNLDAPWVQVASAYLGTRHHRIVLDTPELVADLLPALSARNFPGMADVDSSLLTFCREIKREATVALSGEAADEIFGGYPWFHMEAALKATTFPWARTFDRRCAVWSPELRQVTHLDQYVADRYQEALAEVPRLANESRDDDRLREIAYLSITRFMPTLLDRKDRMSMAVGLEVRVPYCDHRIVEYAWNIPWTYKRLFGHPKGILRQSVADLLPESIVWRQKSPYPSTVNPSYREAMRTWLRQVLADEQSPLRPWINHSYLDQLSEGREDLADIPWFGQLMGTAQLFAFLIQLDYWFRTYHVTVRL
jgi:asparagine synthase (glutamine-hydrolysing)